MFPCEINGGSLSKRRRLLKDSKRGCRDGSAKFEFLEAALPHLPPRLQVSSLFRLISFRCALQIRSDPLHDQQ